MIGISFRTLQRWKGIGLKDRRQGASKRVVRKLDNEQRKEILMTCNSVTYRDKNPYEIVAELLNEGRYLASVSTIYRVLKDADQVHHRSKTNVRKYHSKPPERVANGSNEVWCWDITWMPRAVKGLFYYAYVILDIYDRSIVGWAIHDTESVDYSKALFAATLLKHQAVGTAIHADNGHPMRGLTLMALFQQLSINVSHSRPRTSNDNPYIESWFKTMKYKGSYPRSFDTIEEAREWMAVFVDWYNHTHLHSGLDYVTPAQVRYHDAEAIFKQRNATIMKAKEAFPERWGTRKAKVWEAPQTVILNPDYQ